MVLVYSRNGQYVIKPSLSNAVASADSIGKTIVVTEPITTNSITIPDTMNLRVERSGVITIASGHTMTINSPFECGLYQAFSPEDATASVVFGAGAVNEVYPEWWGAVGDGVTNDKTAIQNAIDASQYATVKLQKRSYRINSGLVISRSHTSIEGSGMWRNDEPASIPANGAGGATQILFYGTGVAIAIGAEDLVNSPYYDSNWYGGTQNGLRGCRFSNFSIRAENQDTSYQWATDSGSSSKYLGGSTAIWDWYNGSIVMTNIMIEHFEQGFVGVQSDINEFYGCQFQACHIGTHIYKRADQNRFVNCEWTICDTGFLNDGARGASLVSPIFTFCGSSTTYALDYTKSSEGMDVFGAWFENQPLSGSSSNAMKAWMALGVTAGYSSASTAYGMAAQSANGFNLHGVIFYTTNAGFFSGGAGTADPAYHVKSLIYLGCCRNVFVRGIMQKSEQSSKPSVNYLIYCDDPNLSSTTNQYRSSIDLDVGYFDVSHKQVAPASQTECISFYNASTGDPSINMMDTYVGSRRIINRNARLTIESSLASTATGAERLDIRQAGAAGAVYMTAPYYATGQTDRFVLRKSWQHGSAAPVAGTYEVGDIIWNNTPTAGGTIGWVCTTGGTPGTWKTFGAISA